jgi:hypothetical protein
VTAPSAVTWLPWPPHPTLTRRLSLPDQEEAVKKFVRWLIVVVVVIWVVQNPAAAAQFGHTAMGWFGQAGHALTTLTSNL